MGKRTKFQVKELAQLTLNVSLRGVEDNYVFTHECNDLPKVSFLIMSCKVIF